MLTASPTPAEVIGCADSQTAPLLERLWAGARDVDLLDAVTALEDYEARLAALRAQLLDEITTRQLPRRTLAWASAGDWYAHTAGLTRRGGHQAVRHAQALANERAATLTALAAGAISQVQAGVICEAIEKLPTNPALRAQAETCLIEEAARLDATQLTQAGARILAHLDPDHDDRTAEADLAREERAAHLDRGLTITPDGAGGVRLRGRGSVEDAATLRAALLPLTKPTPTPDPDHPGEQAEADPRDHGARMWDALIAIAQHSLDTDQAPESHGARPRLSVLINWNDLHDNLNRDRNDAGTETADAGAAGASGEEAVTDDGQRLSYAAVRRLACDADILPITLATTGEVLDVGRRHRLITTALWLALIARDRHCTFPSCTRPPIMCHAHHICHWAHGGPTALTNLALLCGHHHRTIHDTPWNIRLAPDGHPEFQPPPPRATNGHPDQPPDWIRHRPRRE